MTFFSLRCTTYVQALASVKVLLKRSASKWTGWQIRKRSLAGASSILSAFEENVIAGLKLESRKTDWDASGN